MASRARLEEYRRLNADLVRLAERDLASFWAGISKADVAKAREATIAYISALSKTYGRPAALIAAQFYNDLRAASPNAKGSFKASLGNGPPAEEIADGVHWAVSPLVGDEPDDAAALARLAGITQRVVTAHGRNTIADNTLLDPARVLYARVPSGTKTCDYCREHAAQGAVYHGYSAAAGDYHDLCRCVPVLIWSGDLLPAGYNPSDYAKPADADAEGAA